MKKSLYDLLGVLPHASDIEIQAAYMRLAKQYESPAPGRDPVEADLQFKLIKDAYGTLSDHYRRAAYDASLMSQAIPPRVEVEIRETSRNPVRILLMVIGTLFAAGLVIQFGSMMIAFRYSSEANADAKVRLQEYEQTYGESLKTEEARAAARAAEEERRRKQQEEQAQRQREYALEESRRYADRVSHDLDRAEEMARRQAEYERQKLEQEELRRKQEIEDRARQQIEKDKQRLLELQHQNRQNY